MNTPRLVIFASTAVLAGVLTISAQAGAGSTVATTATATNAVPDTQEVPLSVFDVTSSPVKDPFFPHTTRSPLAVAANTNVVAVVDASIFSLKGLSGPLESRLAIINNRTVAAGETAEVTVADGRKIKIHCLEVKENSVILRADNQSSPIELHYTEHYLKH